MVMPTIQTILANNIKLILPTTYVRLVSIRKRITTLIPPLRPTKVIGNGIRLNRPTNHTKPRLNKGDMKIDPRRNTTVLTVSTMFMRLSLNGTKRGTTPRTNINLLRKGTQPPTIGTTTSLRDRNPQNPRNGPPTLLPGIVPTKIHTRRAMNVGTFTHGRQTISNKGVRTSFSFSRQSAPNRVCRWFLVGVIALTSSSESCTRGLSGVRAVNKIYNVLDLPLLNNEEGSVKRDGCNVM